MTTEKITTGTWLPVFPGFYGTFFDGGCMYESEIDFINEHVEPKELAEAMVENLYNSEAGTRLWSDYKLSMSKQCVKIIESELKELNFIESIEFEEISSPKEYNFRNDSINIQVTFSAENIQNIRHYISEHFAKWKEFLKETYTSRDGFISFHSPFPEDEEWFVDNALNDKHNAGSVLEFLCGEHEINSEQLYFQCEENVCIDIESYKKECIKMRWWIPDTWWNRLKSYWEDRLPRITISHFSGGRQYKLNTKKQIYSFAVSKEQVENKHLIVKRFFKVFIFAKLKEEKKVKE